MVQVECSEMKKDVGFGDLLTLFNRRRRYVRVVAEADSLDAFNLINGASELVLDA